MTKRELLRCINIIEDVLIIQAENENKFYYNKMNRMIKYVSLTAACIAVIAIIFTNRTITNVPITKDPLTETITIGTDDVFPSLITFVFDGYIYEILPNPEWYEKWGLPEKIDESILGKVIGGADDIRIGDVPMEKIEEIYEYKGVYDRSVIIVKGEKGNYYYATKCNKFDDTVY